MKKAILVILAAAVCGVLTTVNSAFAQGSLTPPPGAPAPTMLTLSQVEPRTPISTAPYTITSPGSYYVTTNFAVPFSESGITISANNVTLDLNGFTLTGVNQLYDGIVVSLGSTNIVIRNGTIRNWANGAVANSTYNLLAEHLLIAGNSGWGIHFSGSVLVRNCVVTGNGVDGIYVTGGLVSDCVASSGNGAGIEALSSQVRDCLVESNTEQGIVLDGNCQAVGNTLVGNGADSFNVSGNNNRIEDNHVISGGGAYGILVQSPYTNNVIIKNSVSGYGANNYSIAAGNDVGPVGTAATAASPWANISH